MRGSKSACSQSSNDAPNNGRDRKDSDHARNNGNARRKLRRGDRVLL